MFVINFITLTLKRYSQKFTWSALTFVDMCLFHVDVCSRRDKGASMWYFPQKKLLWADLPQHCRSLAILIKFNCHIRRHELEQNFITWIMPLLTPSHSFESCGDPEVLTSASSFKKCGGKLAREGGKSAS